MTFLDKRVLVTGGAGAIGSNLVRRLVEVGSLVTVIDDLSAGKEWLIPNHPNVSFIRGSITDDQVLRLGFRKRPAYVFHLAAFFANQNSVDYPETDLLVSQLGTIKLLEHAVQTGGVERFVYAGSGCAIYGGSAPLPLKEDFVSMHLSTPYQISKFAGEMYCNFYFHHYGLPIVKARFFNSFGPGEVPGRYRNVIPNFIFWAMKGQELPITGDGEMTRDFTFVDDIVDALMASAIREEAIGEEFNIAAGREVKIGYLAERVNQITGNKAGIRYINRRKWDTKSRLLASIEKAGSLLDYSPKVDFDSGLEQTLAWFTDNWEAIDKDAEFPPGAMSAHQAD